jgi:cell division protein FtsX
MPFIFEGLIAGLLGAAIALAVLVVARMELLPKIVVALPFLPMHAATIDGVTFAAELLATGALVGTIASFLSVGRYLRT